MGMETEKKTKEQDEDCVYVCCGPLIWSRSCICCCCPPTRESNSARAVYTAIFAIVLVLSCVSHEMNIVNQMQKEFGASFYNTTCVRLGAGQNCRRITGYQGVYRLCALLFFFHAIMAILMSCVRSSADALAKLHNGFWFWKILLLFGGWVLIYFVPDSEIVITVWKILGIACCILFVLLQQISLVDCAYALNNYLRARAVHNCCYALALYSLTCFIIVADIIAYGFMWRFYASIMEDYRICLVNLVFLSLNGFLALVLCAASFFIVRKGMHMWLQGPFMVTYTLYLTWSAMSNEPPIEISNQLLKEDFSRLHFIPEENRTLFYCRPRGGQLDALIGEHWSQHIMIYLGIVVMLCFALYSSFSTASEHEKFGIRKSRSNLRWLLEDKFLRQHKSLVSLSQASQRHSMHGSAYSLSGVAPTSPTSPTAPSSGDPNVGNVSNSQLLVLSPAGRSKFLSHAGKVSGSVPNLPQHPPLVELGLARARRPSNQQLGSNNAGLPLVDKRLDRLRRSESALIGGAGGRRRTQSACANGEDAGSGSEAGGRATPSGRPRSFAASDSEDLIPEIAGGERRKRKLRAKRPGRLRRESGSASALSLNDRDRLVPLPPPRDRWLLRDEFFGLRYNYTFFHVIFALAALFVMVHLTNWFDPVDSHLGIVGTTWQTVWFKIASCWSAFLLFGASLTCSRLCCGRDLVELHRETLCRNKERKASRAAAGQAPQSSGLARAPALASPMEDEEHGVLLAGAGGEISDSPV